MSINFPGREGGENGDRCFVSIVVVLKVELDDVLNGRVGIGTTMKGEVLWFFLWL